MVILPDQYAETSTYHLLEAVARGRIGFDHRVLRVILDRGKAAVPDLVRFGTRPPAEDEYDLSEELIAIFRQLRTPEAMPFFIEYIRRDPLDVSEDLMDALYPIREAAVEPLLNLYDELGEESGGEVLFMLAGMDVRNDRILRHLVERLDYDLLDATISLGLYGDPAARPALEKELQEAGDDDIHVRRHIEDAIGALGRPQEERPDHWSIWEDFPQTALPEFEDMDVVDLLEYLSSADPEYRMGAAAQTGNVEATEPLVNKLFELAQSDEDPRVRGKCWEALGDQLEKKDIREAMRARLCDGTVPLLERQGALVGLADEAGKAPVRAYAEQFYTADETRAAALKAMYSSMDRSFASYFGKHLDDKDPEVVTQDIVGIGYLGVHESAEKLRRFFEDDNHRAAALFAYALSLRHEISRGRIHGLFRKVEQAAGGLGEEEETLVKVALDERLLLNGHNPVFNVEKYADAFPTSTASVPKVGQNDPCPCGSGKKFKKCCGAD